MSEQNTDPLSRDQAFDILSNRRRRYALHYLSSEGEGVTLQDLAVRIAAWENEVQPDELTKKQRKRVYVSLYQTHIPKLEEAGIVEYEDETGLITLTNRADDVTTYLRADRDLSDRWYRYYLTLVIVSTIVFTASVLDLPVFEAFSPTLVGLAIILSFGALTVAYFLLYYRDGLDSLEELRLA